MATMREQGLPTWAVKSQRCACSGGGSCSVHVAPGGLTRAPKLAGLSRRPNKPAAAASVRDGNVNRQGGLSSVHTCACQTSKLAGLSGRPSKPAVATISTKPRF